MQKIKYMTRFWGHNNTTLSAIINLIPHHTMDSLSYREQPHDAAKEGQGKKIQFSAFIQLIVICSSRLFCANTWKTKVQTILQYSIFKTHLEKKKERKIKGSTGNRVSLLSALPAETRGIKETLLTDCFRQCFQVEKGARRSQGGGWDGASGRKHLAAALSSHWFIPLSFLRGY